MKIRLERISLNNWQQAITLDITDDQRHFLSTPSILYAIAEVQFYPTYTPYALFHHETMVGFAVFGHLPDSPTKWWIALLIIDHRHQGKGYGRAALTAIITSIQGQAPNCHEIALSYKPENTVAERIYLSVGFEKTDEIDEHGQVTMRLKLAPSQ
mgnify:CR=1 FL=1